MKKTAKPKVSGYRIGKEIGRGGMSVVYSATNDKLKSGHAIKVFDVPECTNRATLAEKFAAEMTALHGRPVTVCGSVEEAVRDADIICTVTPSKEAYLKKEWVKPGVHVNAVGTFTPVTREATSELVAASKLYADQVDAMKRESGE